MLIMDPWRPVPIGAASSCCIGRPDIVDDFERTDFGVAWLFIGLFSSIPLLQMKRQKDQTLDD
jgi:hypothetical protein